MRQLTRCLLISIASLSLTIAGVGVYPGTNSALAAQTPKSTRCAAPPYHQFDYWVGDWDAFDVGNPKVVVAHTRVDRILDGCVLLERYDGTNGTIGESFSIYDATRKVWHQSWVTNRGQLLVIEGTIHGLAMVLSGDYIATDGVKTNVRGTWRPVSGSVRESAVKSIDGGKNWTPWFDLVFRPHPSPT